MLLKVEARSTIGECMVRFRDGDEDFEQCWSYLTVKTCTYQ